MSKRQENVLHGKSHDRHPTDELQTGSSCIQLDRTEPRVTGKRKETERINAEDEDQNVIPPKKRKLNNTSKQKATTVVYYDPVTTTQETPLYLKLRTIDAGGRITRYLKWARRLSSELGPCPADLLWRRLLLEDLTETMSQDFDKYRAIVQEWAFDMPNLDPKSKHHNVSSHLTQLTDILRSCNIGDDKFRAVIRVKRSTTAIVLVEVLRAVDDEFPSLRLAAITDSDILGPSQDEATTVKAFATGATNVVVTNKHMDSNKLPETTTVICFDLTEGVLPFSTSLCSISTLVYMAEKDNAYHQELIQSQNELTALPSPRQASTPADAESGDRQTSEFIEDPVTGTRIYPEDAMASLSRYLDYLKGTEFVDIVAVDAGPSNALRVSENRDFRLPLDLPISIDLPQPLRGLATQPSHEATSGTYFAICQDLFNQGYLDSRFFVTPAPAPSPEVDSDDLKTANMSANTRCYPRKRPLYWTRALQKSWRRLYPIVVTVGAFRDGPHAPMLILSRLPWTNLLSFSVFSNGQKATARIVRGTPFEVEEENLDLLAAYTMRVSRALMNKSLECPMEKLNYLYAPLNASWDPSVVDSISHWQLIDVKAHISWAQIEEAADHWVTPLLEGKDAATLSIDDCIIQDRSTEFTNRHFVTRLRRDLTPLSRPDPESREGKYDSYLAFCKEHRKEFQGLRDETQPLIEVSLVPPLVNHLSPASKTHPGSTKPSNKIFIPELCYRFVIPASTFRTTLLLPSITHMIDCMLLVKEMNAAIFSNKIQERHLLEAVTPSAVQMEHNYERLELLGDTVLKKIVSLYYFVTLPAKREGTLNGARAKAVCNKALHRNALAAGIPPWIEGKPLVAKIWAPYVVEGEKEGANDGMDVNQPGAGPSGQGPRKSKQQKRQDEVDVQWLGDKTIADVVEALIGAAFSTGGTEAVLQVMRTLCFRMPEIEQHADFWKVYEPHMSSYRAQLPPKTLKAVSAITGYDFTAHSILADALTHGSCSMGKNWSSYDRLEFLGDSMLDSQVVWYIFQSQPHLSPGGLSLLKSAMVSNQTLATLAVLIGLHEHVRCSADVRTAIMLYAQKIVALRDREYRLAEAENRLPTQFWLELEAPKVLGDVVEAVVAAIYLTDRFEMTGVEAFFQKVLKPFYDRHIRVHTLAQHPSKSLFELLQAEGCQQHTMRKQPAEGGTLSEVVLHGVVLAGAVDVTTNASMRRAANAALDALANDPEFIARNCDCKLQKSGKKAQKVKAKQAGYED